jgi:hypothetical protein
MSDKSVRHLVHIPQFLASGSLYDEGGLTEKKSRMYFVFL